MKDTQSSAWLVVAIVVCLTCAECEDKFGSARLKHSWSDGNDETEEVFKPTKDWQVVKKGQPVPKGLHIRMNLETGLTEAKLLDENEDENSKTAVTQVLEDPKNDGHVFKSEREVEGVQAFGTGDQDESKAFFSGGKFNRDELEQALKNMNGKDVLEVTDEDKQRVANNFRTYEELKKELKNLKLSIKTDAEQMADLLELFGFEDVDDEARVAALTDLEYLVHQWDNAREFVRSGGLKTVVLPALNATSSEVREAGILLLGASLQSNPKVQITALESGFIPTLLRTITLDKNMTVRARALYAISCLVRQFPVAQRKLVDEGALSVFAKLFDSKAQEDLKLQVKVVTLLSDLLQEAKQASLVGADAEKVRQYSAVGLRVHLIEQGWCSRVAGLLGPPVPGVHDVVEQVLTAMNELASLCRAAFRVNPDLHVSLSELKRLYEPLSRSEVEPDDDRYFTRLLQLVHDIERSTWTTLHYEEL